MTTPLVFESSVQLVSVAVTFADESTPRAGALGTKMLLMTSAVSASPAAPPIEIAAPR